MAKRSSDSGTVTDSSPVVTTDLATLKQDPANRRSRTQRGAKMLVDSLESVGAGRSILIDENDEIIAGNGVVEAAAEAGITKVQVVEADGSTLIAVRRRGLTPEDKRAMAMFDNRTAELAEWVPDQLSDDAQHGQTLSPWFTEIEQRKLFKDSGGAKQPKVKAIDTSTVADRFWIAVRGPLAAQASALQRLRELMKDLDGVDVELGLAPVEAAAEEWKG